MLQWSNDESHLAAALLSSGVPSYEMVKSGFGGYKEGVYGLDPYATFSGSDLEAIRKLIDWWSADTAELREQRAYVLVDLNTGVSLCIASKAVRGASDSIENPSFEKGTRAIWGSLGGIL